MVNIDDDILKALPNNGDKAMSLMYEHYYPQLCLKAIRYVKDQKIAEDLVQDLFIDIWKKKANLNINTSLIGYLQRSIVNKSLNWIRSQRVKIEDIDSVMSTSDNAADAQDEIEKTELEEHITKVIDGLPEKCRLVFVMSRFDMMSYKEIGDKLDISTKTVENQISKALRILRVEMKNFAKI